MSQIISNQRRADANCFFYCITYISCHFSWKRAAAQRIDRYTFHQDSKPSSVQRLPPGPALLQNIKRQYPSHFKHQSPVDNDRYCYYHIWPCLCGDKNFPGHAEDPRVLHDELLPCKLCLNMGLPVSYYAFGDTGLLHASIFMAFVVPLVNFFAVLSLGLFSKRSSISTFIGNTLFNPLAIACIAGLTSSYMNMVYPDFVTRTLTIISGVTLPLALFCIGASLTIQQLRGNIFVILLSSGLKLLLMPAITLVLLWLFNQPIDPMAKVLVVMMASPSATVNSIMAATMGGDTNSTNGTIVTTTLLSIFSFIFWLACLGI